MYFTTYKKIPILISVLNSFFYKDSTCARARAVVFGQLHLKMVSLEKQE